MQIFHQVSGAGSSYLDVVSEADPGSDLRGKKLNIGWGLQLWEDDDGLPGLQLDKNERLIPNTAVNLSAQHGLVFEIYDLASGEQYLEVFERPWFDPTGYTHVRFVGDIMASGSAAAHFRLRCSDTPHDINSWEQVGSHYHCRLSLAESGAIRGDWVEIRSDLVKDNVWQATLFEYDALGTAQDPIVGYLGIEFSKSPYIPKVKWYFRDIAPAFTALSELGTNLNQLPSDGYYLDFWFPPFSNQREVGRAYAANQIMYWSTPSASAVCAAPGSLLRDMNPSPANVYNQVDSVLSPQDQSGIIGRFVTPPLAAQTLHKGTGIMGFAAGCGPGAAAGYIGAEIHIVRPGVPYPLATWRTHIEAVHGAWFRYVTKQREMRVSWGDFELLDNDRIVVDLITTMVWDAGVMVVAAANFFFYDGGDDTFVDGADLVGTYAASYIELPDLVTLSSSA